MKTYEQATRISTPWSRGALLGRGLFWLTWLVLCRPTPKAFYRYRNLILRLFGAKIEGTPFVDASVRIHFPWMLVLAHEACIGARVDVYNLDVVTLGERAVVAQDSMLCCGTHDFASVKQELMTAPIAIGRDAFIGARAIILPGVSVGERAIIGAGAVLGRDAAPGGVYAGNPATLLRQRDAITAIKSGDAGG